MNNIAHSITGAFHVIASIAALIAGTAVLLMRKGTRNHKRCGYTYITFMLLTNGSAMFLYGLFGGLGPFHFAAVFSMFSIIVGLVPLLNRKNPDWLKRHLYWLYFSVFGLYAALASEILTRVIEGSFFVVVGIASVSILWMGAIILSFKLKKWLKSVKRSSFNFEY